MNNQPKHYVFIGQTTSVGFKGSANAEKHAKKLWEQGQDAVLVIQTPNFYVFYNGVTPSKQFYSFDEVSKALVPEFSND